MAIDFMVLGGPRSATTWAANWLTTDSTFCLHDPLLEYTIRRLENLVIPGKRLGIACTSSILYPKWINKHPAKKILVYRDIEEINASLRRLGLDELEKLPHLSRMNAIRDVPIFTYEQLFMPSSAEIIAKHLGVPWCPHRHDLLAQMNVQPEWRHLNAGKEACEQLIQRIREAR